MNNEYEYHICKYDLKKFQNIKRNVCKSWIKKMSSDKTGPSHSDQVSLKLGVRFIPDSVPVVLIHHYTTTG